ncbi:MAG: aldehyde dehydrogenase family protein [Porticoccaceae bacterium]|jgi:acyl-CoA reductase-like NAD-dependent aldehyde dehydrogenase|nr:aldehyde dehydrogenase family protein [Porticoccaceae bacterium]
MLEFFNALSGSPASGDFASVYNPYSGEEVGRVELSNWQNVDTGLAEAYAIFRDRKRWLSASQRIEVLEKTVELMKARFEDLAVIALSEGGKPLLDSRVEVTRAIDGVRNCIDLIRNDHGKELPMCINAASEGRLAFTHKEPIGVVAALSAFNHPLNLIVHQVCPAIASGCPVIIKPARDTALSCFALVDILKEAGLPEGYCTALLTDSHETAEKLVADPRLGFFSFIGSAAVGWRLQSSVAPGTRCALEHGGVAPVIVEADADLKRAIPSIAKGGFYHAGQVCVSVQRVYVHSSIVDLFAETLGKIARNLVVGDPADEKTEVGPLIRQAENDRVSDWVDEAVAEGAKLVCGGSKIDQACYQPTVLLNPNPDSKVSTSEVFGPVICVYGYDNLDDAIARANSLRVSFQSAVFTQDIDKAMYIQRHLDASAVMVNDHTAFRVDWMPFAGLRESGLGVGGIPYSFEEMQVSKLLVIKSPGLKD